MKKRERRLRTAAVVLLLVLACVVPASATTLPGGFGEVDIVAGGANLNGPTAVAYAPDGRTFVAEKAGRVKVVQPGSSSATTLINLSSKVNSYSDRGLLGIAVDKDFAANGFLYLLYVYELDPNTPDSSAPMVSRLTRVTVRPDNSLALPAGSSDPETVILGKDSASPCPVPDNTRDCITADFYWHTIGTVRSDPVDGTLWLGSGDSHAPAVDQHTWRTYDESSFAGKIIHIDRNGRGLPGHPFCPGDSNLDHVCTKIYAKGFRNPFRFHLRPGKGPVVGDVGQESWEEVDFVEPGRNYGWPCYEGTRQRLTAQPQCQALFAQEGTPEAATPPDWQYAHAGGASITLGPIYDGLSYPSHFRGDLFVGDYVQGWIKRLEIGPDDEVTEVHPFATDWTGGVDLEMHPSGDLSNVDIGWAFNPPAPAVTRYTYTGSTNSPPDAVASATPTSGPPPLAVQFTGSGTTDPDGDALTFDWDFGDASAHSSLADPSHTYASAGDYTARLTVTDSQGNSSARSVPITVTANAAPSVTIEAPVDESLYRDGVAVGLRGSATDAEDGPLTGISLQWRIQLHHNTHIHGLSEPTGAEASFTPLVDHDADSFYEIRLTATDSGGRSSSRTIRLRPETSDLELASSPAGALLTYGDHEEPAPSSREAAIGFQAPVSAPETFVRGGRTYRFQGWSDGGARAHSISVPPGSPQYTATYRAEGMDTLVFQPVADTHVDDLNPTTSYGSEPSFEVDDDPEHREALLKFDLDGIDGRQVVGARLALRQTDGSVHGGDVHAVGSNAWTEAVTWNTKPALGAKLASFGPVVFRRDYEVDLAAGVVSGDGLLSLGMSTPDANGSSWASRESSTPPRLIVEVEKYACANGRDDDGDGNADFPADLGCLSAADDDENQAPVAAAGASPLLGDAPLSVAFSAAGSVDPEGDSLGYEWDFGDGSAGSSAAAANHLYTAPGTYTATLTVTDEHGVSDTATVEVEVTEPVRAVAGATPTSGTAPLTVQFKGSDSVDPEGGELDHDWDFGDGSAGSSVADPSHVYSTPGTYTATLTASAGGGRDDSALVEVRVAAPACDDGEDDDGDGKVDFPADLGCMSKADDDENTAPGAAIGAIPVSGDVPLSVAFSAVGSVDPEGDSLGYEWDFGDGSAGSSAAAVDHVYTAPGTYTATLVVTDERGVSDTATVEVEVTEPVRAVAGATPTSGRAPLPVQFTGSDSVDPEGGSLGYEWDFGDGSVGSSVADPSHVYMTPGTYTATLTVDAGGGREDSASVEVRVAESPVEEPGSNVGQPGSNAGQPGSNAGQPGSNAGEPASPLPPPAFTGVKIQRRSVALKRGVASIRLTCSASAAAMCSGKLALTARVGAAELQRSARARGSGARKTVRLSTVRFSIASGATARVRVKLSRRGRRLLEAHRRLKATAQVTAHDGLMRKRVTESSLVLKLKRSRAGTARSGG